MLNISTNKQEEDKEDSNKKLIVEMADFTSV